MYRWITPPDETRVANTRVRPTPGDERASRPCYLFAAAHSSEPNRLALLLAGSADPVDAETSMPRVSVTGSSCDVEVAKGPGPGSYSVVLVIPAATLDPHGTVPADDELRFVVTVAEGPSCEVILRRTSCRISVALIERREAVPLRAQTRAAILWYAWRRFSEVLGLKRFTSGLSGSDVLVFRPRLRDPDTSRPTLTGAGLPGVVSEAWGACMLVKTAKHAKVREEWDRFDAFLADRVHPFMARSETFLTALPDGSTCDQEQSALQGLGRERDIGHHGTIIGSFLGGDLLRAEPLEQLVLASPEAGRCVAALRRLFSVVATWYGGAAVRPLGDWSKMFRTADDGSLLLFGKFDLRQRADRDRYADGLAWDVTFVKEDHLSKHLLGRQRDGLLYRLMRDVPVRFSLTHGDLQPRNVLADDENIWLIDFGETCVAPTLFDFAKLEIYLRLWCLPLGDEVHDTEDAASAFESHLLDHMTGSEASLAPLAAIADKLGAEPDQLLRVAQCVTTIRDLAAPYGTGSPDRRDYLAVLYLTVLNTLRFTASPTSTPAHFRLLVALSWVLEEVLSRLVGMEPFARGRGRVEPTLLLASQWLAAPGAPGRVAYLLGTDDGADALGAVAAMRGVLQNQHHHLDVFDHTLLVLAFVEEIVGADDPLDVLLNPAAADRRVHERLAEQGVRLPAPARPVEPGALDLGPIAGALDDIRRLLSKALTDDARLLLKWTALLHDVGKPATRAVNLTTKSRGPQTQFLGHEVYGLQRLASHLVHLFPDPATRHRIQCLIRWHHDHHGIVNHLLEPGRLDAMKTALSTGVLAADEHRFLRNYIDPATGKCPEDFPLLVLHGFADMAACRGPASRTSLRTVAEIDLIVLAVAARFPDLMTPRQARAASGASPTNA